MYTLEGRFVDSKLTYSNRTISDSYEADHPSVVVVPAVEEKHPERTFSVTRGAEGESKYYLSSGGLKGRVRIIYH